MNQSTHSAAGAANAWICKVCGHIHYGTEPPDECPVCGVGKELFEPYVPEKAPESLTVPGRVRRVVIVGAGVAGVSAAEAVRKADPQADLTLISDEPDLPYFRVNLTRYLAGELDAGQLEMHTAEWYSERRIKLEHLELRALRPEERRLAFTDGTQMEYDKLIVTLGSHPFLPPFEGADQTNVFTLRRRRDADGILAACRIGGSCVCIGGGLLGLETAAALARRGDRVTVVEHQPWPLSRQLNQRAGAVFQRKVEALGIVLRTGAQTRRLTGNGRVRGVELDDGTLLSADLVVISAGVRANLSLAREAGLQVGQGIIVDDAMRTSLPDIYAAGDAVEHAGVVYGTWAPAQMQGITAGQSAAGLPAVFVPMPRAATLKAVGVEVFSIGQVAPTDAGDRVVEAEIEGNYFCFVCRDQRLVGAILLGKASLASQVKRLVESGSACPVLPTAADWLRFLEVN